MTEREASTRAGRETGDKREHGLDREAARAYSEWFETRLGERVWEDERRALDQLLGPVAGQRILDAGAGDGRLAVELALEGARVTALDLSPAMLDRARLRVQRNGVRIATVQGDVNALPFPPATFDRIIAVTVLCFVSEPQQAVREFARVLVPGGTLVVGELGRWSAWNLFRWFRGRLGASRWRGARFWNRRALERLLSRAHLHPDAWTSAVFYTPRAHDRKGVRTLERTLRGRTTMGASFLAVRGAKPHQE